MKKTKGFTLLELIVAVGVLSILLGIGIIKLDFLGSYREKMEINSIVDGINYARNNAINTGKVSKIIIINSEKIMLVNNDGKTDKIIKFENLKLSGINNNSSFHPTGAPEIGGTYVFTGKNKQYEITILPATGKVNLHESKKKN